MALANLCMELATPKICTNFYDEAFSTCRRSPHIAAASLQAATLQFPQFGTGSEPLAPSNSALQRNGRSFKRPHRVFIHCTLAGDFTQDYSSPANQQKIDNQELTGVNGIANAGHAAVPHFHSSGNKVATYADSAANGQGIHHSAGRAGLDASSMNTGLSSGAVTRVSATSSIGLSEAWPGIGGLDERIDRRGHPLGRTEELNGVDSGRPRFGTPGDVSAKATKLDPDSKVAIIGSGVSGIAACKALTEAGIDVTVFEARERLGGIWSRTYPTTSLQTPRTAYRFSDWDWPVDAPMNPRHDQVVEYLQGYIEHFQLGDKFKFNSRIAEMQRPEGGRRGWRLRIQRKRTNEDGSLGEVEEQWLQFDFVVNCCGCFGDVPNIPQFAAGEGPDVFGGTVMHSAQYSGLGPDGCEALLRGKRVVVVGFQKTAIDVAIEAAEANKGSDGKPCTLLFRKPHWLVPRNQLIFGVPLKYLLLTRFSELFHRTPNQSPLLTALQTVLPLRALVGKLVEAYLCGKYPLQRHGLVPSHSLVDDVAACILPQMPPAFFPLVEAGRVQLARAPRWRFTPAGVELDDGRQLAADVVLLCTGYDALAKLRGLLPAPYAGQLSSNGRSLYLYRGVIHPRVPNMAFLGFHEGASSVQTSEMGARWLAKLLQGAFALPDEGAMERDRREWWEFKRAQSPFAGRVSCVAPIHSWHFDLLCRDMGWSPWRKKGWVANLFSPHTSADYVEREADRRATAEEKRAAHGGPSSEVKVV